ncbi:MAG: GatB/YqeY domain-containing protein [Thermoanaerobaculia bacterium]|nr:GatB/YqeY domain-containing protein [Thermoanaerobaculia bacterium]
MSTPQERLQDDLKAAMKARDKERLSTLRMLLTAVKNERIASGEELGEDAFLTVVKRLVKQRRDSVEQYRSGGREELADKEDREIRVLEEYLPEQVSEDDIRSAVEAFVAENDLSGPRGIGPVMKEMLARFGAAADGSAISRIARDVLGS